MPGHRISSLPLAQFCGQAPALGEKYSGTAERAAAQSSYFHAVCAGEATKAAQLRAALSPEELAEIDTWHAPQRCELDFPEEPVTLEYRDAEKELEVMIAEDGEYTEDPTKAITIGHLDFAWPRTWQGRKVAFIADIKRSAWTVRNPNSLQLLSYGWAYSKKIGAEAFVPGIWAAQEGSWAWGEWVSMDPFDNLDLWWRIRHAALNQGPASIGPHCRNCFGRLHCKEWLFPPGVQGLSAFAEGHEPTGEEVADAVLAAQGMKDVAERILDNAKEYARRGNKVVAANGAEFKVAMRNGRETADIKKLRGALGAEAEQYIKRGEPFPFPSWSNPK